MAIRPEPKLSRSQTSPVCAESAAVDATYIPGKRQTSVETKEQPSKTVRLSSTAFLSSPQIRHLIYSCGFVQHFLIRFSKVFFCYIICCNNVHVVVTAVGVWERTRLKVY